MREIPTKEECEKWKLNKLINPITLYPLKNKSGKVYKTLKKACEGIQTPPHSPPKIPKEIPYKDKIIDKDICHIWLKNPLINPFTNTTIHENKGTYKIFKNACFKLGLIDVKGKLLKPLNKKVDIKKEIKETKNPIRKLKREPTEEECEKWRKNKLVNPITNIRIIKDGEIYKKLEKICKGTPPKPKSLSPIIEEKEVISSIKDIKIKKKERKINKEDNKEDNIDGKYYPDLDDEDFNEKLLSLKEVQVHKIRRYDDINSLEDFEKKSKELCIFEKSSFQYLMSHYLSFRTPYRSMLLYYSVGVGKTCTAITIAESLLINHNSFDEPMIWVILPSAIEGGFKNQIFETIKLADFSSIARQCTGDTYVKLANISKELDSKIAEKRIKKLIKSRYYFFTYEGFANYIDINYTSKGKIVSDKVIIVDEAHNIRSDKEDEENKRVYSALIEVCRDGINNRLIFLTATPMYNEPTDIYTLFYLLLLNDKREELFDNSKIFDNDNNLNPSARDFIIKMSSNYISYLRGKNPFNFAFKLSPKLSGFKILDKVIPYMENGKAIDKTEENWISNMEDGIITTPLTQKQKTYLENRKAIDVVKNNFEALQVMNIVYDGFIGSEGFNNFFIKTGDKDQLFVKYNSKYKNALSPSPDKLGLYSSKLSKIADIIKNTNGVIVIYSRFVWSGIIPLAITLEHMGFSREGTNNILTEPDITHNTTYPNIKYPKYCILSSSDPEIMGNTTINGLMTKINHPDNKDGSIVKAILITQVASEGLNFYNIREMHLIDAWFHFNRIDQIIGRGIRNCSHKNLPIEERNVSVFLHASIDGYERETADINAYRIATRKLYQTKVIDELIRNSSIDCSLFKNINYFDKDLFKLGELDIITSQGVKIKYQLGDDKSVEPKCKIDLDKIKENSVGFREETYKHLSLNIRNKIREYILTKVNKYRERFISMEELKKVFEFVDEKILMYALKMSIYPNVIIDNILIIPHKDGLHIIDVIEDTPLKIALEKIVEDDVKEDELINEKFYEKMENIRNENYNNAVIGLYLGLDEITFKMLIKKIFMEKKLDKIDSFIENCFVKEGVLITGKEINGIPVINKYIGFINIFNETFEPLIYNEDGINHKNLNAKQIEQLKKNRRLIQKPLDLKNEVMPFGMILPKYIDKEKTNKMNVFKILTTGIITGEKTGMVCQSFKKMEHLKMFKELGLKDDKGNKDIYCYKIATELYKKNRMILLPEYKPI